MTPSDLVRLLNLDSGNSSPAVSGVGPDAEGESVRDTEAAEEKDGEGGSVKKENDNKTNTEEDDEEEEEEEEEE